MKITIFKNNLFINGLLCFIMISMGFSNIDFPVLGCPMKNAKIIIPAERQKYDMSQPSIGRIINSETDSLVFPITTGQIVKIIDTTFAPKIIIKHSDSLYSVYIDIESVFVNTNDKVTMDSPIAKARKTNNSWSIFLQIWIGSKNIYPDELLTCDKK